LAILERDIKHPLAQIIYKEAFNLSRISGTNFSFIVIGQEYIPGQGIKATLLNKSNQLKIEVLVGNQKLLTENGVETKNLKSSR
jgi:cation transport ATPase